MTTHHDSGKGDCFEAAGKLFMDMAFCQRPVVLVHAEVRGQGPIEGVRFGHAWVEVPRALSHDDLVIDPSNGRWIELPRSVYYAAGAIDWIGNQHRYTWNDFKQAVQETQHWGPWDLVLTDQKHSCAEAI